MGRKLCVDQWSAEVEPRRPPTRSRSSASSCHRFGLSSRPIDSKNMPTT